VPPGPPPVAQVVLDGIDLVNAGTDHIQFSLKTHLVSRSSVRVKRISFAGTHVGGVPVYMGPVEGPLELRAGQNSAVPAIPLTIYFRDLDSLAPLERIVREGKVGVEGRARVQFDLNIIQKLALRQWSARAEFPIDQSLPVMIPGGEMGRLAALTALQAANTAIGMAGSALGSLRRSQVDWQDQIGKQYMPALIMAETRYSVITPEGQQLDITQDGVGFQIPNRKFVLTSEMIEPWKYNADVASMLQDKHARLLTESVDLMVWPADAPIEMGTARSVRQGSVRVIKVRDAEENVEVPGKGGYSKVRVSKRDSTHNLATLEFTNGQDGMAPLPLAPKDHMKNESWDRVAVFRFTESTRPEVLFVPAHRDGSRLVLDALVDESAFGSPVLTPLGAVAMLQDEHTGLMLDKVF
jgi:hypothetical protein